MSKKKELVFRPEMALVVTDQIIYSHKESGRLYKYDDFVRSLGQSKVLSKMYLGSFIASCLRKELGVIKRNSKNKPSVLFLSHSDREEEEMKYVMLVGDELGIGTMLFAKLAPATQGILNEYEPPTIVVTHVDDRYEFVFLYLGKEIIVEYHESFSKSLFKTFELKCYEILNKNFESLGFEDIMEKKTAKRIWEETTTLEKKSVSETPIDDVFDTHITLEELCVHIKSKLISEELKIG